MFVFVFNGECLKMDKYYFCLVRDLEGEKQYLKDVLFLDTVESSLFFLPKKKKNPPKANKKRKNTQLWLLQWSQTEIYL